MDSWDCLGRTLCEIEALQAIFGLDDEVCEPVLKDCKFTILSRNEMKIARALLDSRDNATSIPFLEIEVGLMVELEPDHASTNETRLDLRFKFPEGYPESTPAVVSLSTAALNRSLREEMAAKLNETSKGLIGQEAVMTLLEEAKQILPYYFVMRNDISSKNVATSIEDSDGKASYGRRWIWVHHIKDQERRKSIIFEANGFQLAGYLKYGYPGVIVVEGKSGDCNEFVAWVKGNKSRPGGFGRNWGHHVRGHLDFESRDGLRFDGIFGETDDMALLGGECKERGVEDEFLEFVMQHRGNGS